ncbi:Glycosyl transferase, group 2 family protein [Nostocoides japonicum T1-X7]|uniref:Glycosyl transferase, group 2 family protein n=1 Tax=Nostocoides japonicum T1-X7 TaxID=1194083 RepID=A0A077M0D1_9MICO|nr:glycosyltransferase [Tetrasphaera japonica]CCH78577.1 Glycosyl transferase, group 2 family protein [Tetrasphaera japonica T1-X7]CCH79364.1 Glycosyl transferase, group 2 family protein [Tetrasphaera japonica T1-X7]
MTTDTASSLDARLLDPALRTAYAREGWIPLRREDGVVVVAVAGEPTADRQERISAAVGGPITIVPWSWGAVTATTVDGFAAQYADQAGLGLYRTDPVHSARHVLSRGQQLLGLVLAAIVLLVGVRWPGEAAMALVGVSSLVFLASTMFKFVVAMRGSRYDLVERVERAEIEALHDDDLPVYTILVPVFREARVVSRLMDNLGRVDYPTDKLEVIVLVEEEDDETREAIARSDPPDHFVVVTVPKGAPQTKPRACNVGLEVARGEFLVIYDAEDAPEPDQLKKAVLAFRRVDHRTVVLQASLNYFNARENVLTRMFTLEYSYWFDYMLTGLDVRDLPIPLGGTSNHFRTEALRRLGGWDPFNVTEDADLGIRASALGYRVGVIDSTTMEEGTSRIRIFIGQRSRWVKGYLQTALVHARQPARAVSTLGARRLASFALLIFGTPLTFLGVLPFTVLTLATIIVPWTSPLLDVPPLVLWLCLINFLVGNALMVYLNMMGPYKRGEFWLVGWAVLNPLYWLLHSIASYKALWQLITKPHYWQKTEHGLSTYDPDGGHAPGGARQPG